MKLQVTLNGPAETQVVVDNISEGLPTTGILSVRLDGGTTYKIVVYSSYVDNTFTINSTDFSTTPASYLNNVYYNNVGSEGSLYNIYNYYSRMLYPLTVIGPDKLVYNDAIEQYDSDYDNYSDTDQDGLYSGAGTLTPPEETMWKVQANQPLSGANFCLVWGKINGLATEEVYSVSPMYSGNLRLQSGLDAPLDNPTEAGLIITADNMGWVLGPDCIKAYSAFEAGSEPNTVRPVGDAVLSFNGVSWLFIDYAIFAGVYTGVQLITE
jgi:hypothetical protein